VAKEEGEQLALAGVFPTVPASPFSGALPKTQFDLIDRFAEVVQVQVGDRVETYDPSKLPRKAVRGMEAEYDWMATARGFAQGVPGGLAVAQDEAQGAMAATMEGEETAQRNAARIYDYTAETDTEFVAVRGPSRSFQMGAQLLAMSKTVASKDVAKALKKLTNRRQWRTQRTALEAALAKEKRVSLAVVLGAVAKMKEAKDAKKLDEFKEAIMSAKTKKAPGAFVVTGSEPFPADALAMARLNFGKDPFMGVDPGMQDMITSALPQMHATPNLRTYLRKCGYWIEALPAYASLKILLEEGGSWSVAAETERTILDTVYHTHADDWMLNIMDVEDSEYTALARRQLLHQAGADREVNAYMKRRNCDRVTAELEVAKKRNLKPETIAHMAVLIAETHHRLYDEVVALREVHPEFSRMEALWEILTTNTSGRNIFRRADEYFASIEKLQRLAAYRYRYTRDNDQAGCIFHALRPVRPMPNAHILTTLAPPETQARILQWLRDSCRVFYYSMMNGYEPAVQKEVGFYKARQGAIATRLSDDMLLDAASPEVRAETNKMAVLMHYDETRKKRRAQATKIWDIDEVRELADRRRIINEATVELLTDEGEEDTPLNRRTYRRQYAQQVEAKALSIARTEILNELFKKDELNESEARSFLLNRAGPKANYYTRMRLIAQKGKTADAQGLKWTRDFKGPNKGSNACYTPSRVDLDEVAAKWAASESMVPKLIGPVDEEAADAALKLYGLYNVAGPRAARTGKGGGPAIAELEKSGENAFTRGNVYYLSLAAAANIIPLQAGDFHRDVMAVSNKRGDRKVLPAGIGYAGFCVPKEFCLIVASVVAARDPGTIDRVLTEFGVPDIAALRERIKEDIQEAIDTIDGEPGTHEWSMGAADFFKARLLEYDRICRASGADFIVPPMQDVLGSLEKMGVISQPEPGRSQAWRQRLFEQAHWMNEHLVGLEMINRSGPFRRVEQTFEVLREQFYRDDLTGAELRQHYGNSLGRYYADQVVLGFVAYKGGVRDVRFSTVAREIEVYVGTAIKHLLAHFDPKGREIFSDFLHQLAYNGYKIADLRLMGMCAARDLAGHVPMDFRPYREEAEKVLIKAGATRNWVSYNAKKYGQDLQSWEWEKVWRKLPRARRRGFSMQLWQSGLIGKIRDNAIFLAFGDNLVQIEENAEKFLQAKGLTIDEIQGFSSRLDAGAKLDAWAPMNRRFNANEKAHIERALGGAIHLVVLFNRNPIPMTEIDEALKGTDVVTLDIDEPEMVALTENLPKLVYLLKQQRHGRPFAPVVLDGTSGARFPVFMLHYASEEYLVKLLYALAPEALYRSVTVSDEVIDRYRDEMEHDSAVAGAFFESVTRRDWQGARDALSQMRQAKVGDAPGGIASNERCRSAQEDAEIAEARELKPDVQDMYDMRYRTLTAVNTGMPVEEITFGMLMALGLEYSVAGQETTRVNEMRRQYYAALKEYSQADRFAEAQHTAGLSRKEDRKAIGLLHQPLYQEPKIAFRQAKGGVETSLKATEDAEGGRTGIAQRLLLIETEKAMAARLASFDWEWGQLSLKGAPARKMSTYYKSARGVVADVLGADRIALTPDTVGVLFARVRAGLERFGYEALADIKDTESERAELRDEYLAEVSAAFRGGMFTAAEYKGGEGKAGISHYLGRIAEEVMNDKDYSTRKQALILSAAELLDMALLFEQASGLFIAEEVAGEVNHGQTWLALGEFFDLSLNDHIFDTLPNLLTGEWGAAFKGDRVERQEKFNLCQQRFGLLYSLCRRLMVERTELENRDDVYIEELLGNVRLGRGNNIKVARTALGINVDDAAEEAWFHYVWLRHYAVRRLEQYLLPEVCLDFDPALINAVDGPGGWAVNVSDYPQSNAHLLIASEGNTAKNFDPSNPQLTILCQFPFMDKPNRKLDSAMPPRPLFLNDGFLGVPIQVYGQYLLSVKGMSVAQAQKECASLAVASRANYRKRLTQIFADADMTPEQKEQRIEEGMNKFKPYVSVAVKFSQPVRAHSVFNHFTHQMRKNLHEARLPSVQPLAPEAYTHARHHCEIALSNVEEAVLPPGATWTPADRERNPDTALSRARRRIMNVVEQLPEGWNAVIVKLQMGSGGRGHLLLPVLGPDGVPMGDNVTALAERAVEISLIDKASIQGVIPSQPQEILTEPFLERVADDLTIQLGESVEIGRTPMYFYFRLVGEKDAGGNIAVCNPIVVVSVRGIANVGQGGALYMYAHDDPGFENIIKPGYANQVRSSMEVSLLASMNAAEEYLADPVKARAVIEEYLSRYLPEYAGSIDIDRVLSTPNLLGELPSSLHHVMIDFMVALDENGEPVVYVIEKNPGAGLWAKLNEEFTRVGRPGEGVHAIFSALNSRAIRNKALIDERLGLTEQGAARFAEAPAFVWPSETAGFAQRWEDAGLSVDDMSDIDFEALEGGNPWYFTQVNDMLAECKTIAEDPRWGREHVRPVRINAEPVAINAGEASRLILIYGSEMTLFAPLAEQLAAEIKRFGKGKFSVYALHREWIGENSRAIKMLAADANGDIQLCRSTDEEPLIMRPQDRVWFLNMGGNTAAEESRRHIVAESGLPEGLNPNIAASILEDKDITYKILRDTGYAYYLPPYLLVSAQSQTPGVMQASVQDAFDPNDNLYVGPNDETEGRDMKYFTAAQREEAIAYARKLSAEVGRFAIMRREAGTAEFRQDGDEQGRKVVLRLNTFRDSKGVWRAESAWATISKSGEAITSPEHGGSRIGFYEAMRGITPEMSKQLYHKLLLASERAAVAMDERINEDTRATIWAIGQDWVVDPDTGEMFMLDANPRPVLMGSEKLAPFDEGMAEGYRSQPYIGGRVLCDVLEAAYRFAETTYTETEEIAARARLLSARLPRYFDSVITIQRAQSEAGGASSATMDMEDALALDIASTAVAPNPLNYTEVKVTQAVPIAASSDRKIDISRSGRRVVLVVGADGHVGALHLAALLKAFGQLEGRVDILGGLDLNDPSERTRTMWNDNNPDTPLPPFFKTPEEAVAHAKELGLKPGQITVIVATQNHLHLQNMRELAELGVVEFIVEKPIADTLEEMDEIIEYARENGLKVVGAGQVFTSDVVATVKDVMSKYGVEPTEILLTWKKDRFERSIGGQNMVSPGIFGFDMFHLIGTAETIADSPCEVGHAFSRDMPIPDGVTLPPGMSFEDHGLGVAFAMHDNAVRTVLYTSFVEDGVSADGKTLANQKTINVRGRDDSIIIADVASGADDAESVTYINPQGEVQEVITVAENTVDMMATAQAHFIHDVVIGPGRRDAMTSLDFHRNVEVFIEDCARLSAESRAGQPRRVYYGNKPADIANRFAETAHKSVDSVLETVYPNAELAEEKQTQWQRWLDLLFKTRAGGDQGPLAFSPDRDTVLAWSPGRAAIPTGGRHADYVGLMGGSLGFPVIEGVAMFVQEVDGLDGAVEVYCLETPADDVKAAYPDGAPRIFNLNAPWMKPPADIAALEDDAETGKPGWASYAKDALDARLADRTDPEDKKPNYADDLVAGSIAFLQTDFGDSSGKARQTIERLRKEGKGLRIALASDSMPGGHSTSSDIQQGIVRALNRMYDWGLDNLTIINTGYSEYNWAGTQGGAKDHATFANPPLFLGIAPVRPISELALPAQLLSVAFDTGVSRDVAKQHSPKLMRVQGEHPGLAPEDVIRGRTGIGYALGMLWLRTHHRKVEQKLGLKEDELLDILFPDGLNPEDLATNPYGFGRELVSNLLPVEMLTLLRAMPEEGMTRNQMYDEFGELGNELDMLFAREKVSPEDIKNYRYPLREMLQFGLTEEARSYMTVETLREMAAGRLNEPFAYHRLIEIAKAAHNGDRVARHKVTLRDIGLRLQVDEDAGGSIPEVSWNTRTSDQMLDEQIAKGRKFTMLDFALGKAGYGHLERSLKPIDLMVDLVEAFNQHYGGNICAGVIVGAGLGGGISVIMNTTEVREPTYLAELTEFLRWEYYERLNLEMRDPIVDTLGNPAMAMDVDLRAISEVSADRFAEKTVAELAKELAGQSPDVGAIKAQLLGILDDDGFGGSSRAEVAAATALLNDKSKWPSASKKAASTSKKSPEQQVMDHIEGIKAHRVDGVHNIVEIRRDGEYERFINFESYGPWQMQKVPADVVKRLTSAGLTSVVILDLKTATTKTRRPIVAQLLWNIGSVVRQLKDTADLGGGQIAQSAAMRHGELVVSIYETTGSGKGIAKVAIQTGRYFSSRKAVDFKRLPELNTARWKEVATADRFAEQANVIGIGGTFGGRSIVDDDATYYYRNDGRRILKETAAVVATGDSELERLGITHEDKDNYFTKDGGIIGKEVRLSNIADNVTIAGNSEVYGKNTTIGRGAIIEVGSVIERAFIGDYARINNSIVMDSVVADADSEGNRSIIKDSLLITDEEEMDDWAFDAKDAGCPYKLSGHQTHIAKDSNIVANTTIVNTRVDAGSNIADSHITNCEIGAQNFIEQAKMGLVHTEHDVTIRNTGGPKGTEVLGPTELSDAWVGWGININTEAYIGDCVFTNEIVTAHWNEREQRIEHGVIKDVPNASLIGWHAIFSSFDGTLKPPKSSTLHGITGKQDPVSGDKESSRHAYMVVGPMAMVGYNHRLIGRPFTTYDDLQPEHLYNPDNTRTTYLSPFSYVASDGEHWGKTFPGEFSHGLSPTAAIHPWVYMSCPAAIVHLMQSVTEKLPEGQKDRLDYLPLIMLETGYALIRQKIQTLETRVGSAEPLGKDRVELDISQSLDRLRDIQAQYTKLLGQRRLWIFNNGNPPATWQRQPDGTYHITGLRLPKRQRPLAAIMGWDRSKTRKKYPKIMPRNLPDPERIDIPADLRERIDPSVRILPGTAIEGDTSIIGDNCLIGKTRVTNSTVGANSSILFSSLDDTLLGEDSTVQHSYFLRSELGKGNAVLKSLVHATTLADENTLEPFAALFGCSFGSRSALGNIFRNTEGGDFITSHHLATRVRDSKFPNMERTVIDPVTKRSVPLLLRNGTNIAGGADLERVIAWLAFIASATAVEPDVEIGPLSFVKGKIVSGWKIPPLTFIRGAESGAECRLAGVLSLSALEAAFIHRFGFSKMKSTMPEDLRWQVDYLMSAWLIPELREFIEGELSTEKGRSFTKAQLEDGLRTLDVHMDGRWEMLDETFVNGTYSYDGKTGMAKFVPFGQAKVLAEAPAGRGLVTEVVSARQKRQDALQILRAIPNIPAKFKVQFVHDILGDHIEPPTVDGQCIADLGVRMWHVVEDVLDESSDPQGQTRASIFRPEIRKEQDSQPESAAQTETEAEKEPYVKVMVAGTDVAGWTGKVIDHWVSRQRALPPAVISPSGKATWKADIIEGDWGFVHEVEGRGKVSCHVFKVVDDETRMPLTKKQMQQMRDDLSEAGIDENPESRFAETLDAFCQMTPVPNTAMQNEPLSLVTIPLRILRSAFADAAPEEAKQVLGTIGNELAKSNIVVDVTLGPEDYFRHSAYDESSRFADALGYDPALSQASRKIGVDRTVAITTPEALRGITSLEDARSGVCVQAEGIRTSDALFALFDYVRSVALLARQPSSNSRLEACQVRLNALGIENVNPDTIRGLVSIVDEQVITAILRLTILIEGAERFNFMDYRDRILQAIYYLEQV